MRVTVRAAFYAFNAPMEGEVAYFYQDVKGLVSIGVGLLCDPIQLALNLPMVHPDGRLAGRDEIAAEWMRIKALGSGDHTQGNEAARRGHLYAKPHTRLRLTQEGLEQSLVGKMNQMDQHLAKRFRCVAHDECKANEEMGILDGYESWPADAQLATLSLAWACGPAFRFPKLEAALRALDFRTAAVECFMPEERTISGLRPRNAANRILYENAAVVLGTLDPDVLFYPVALDRAPVDKEADTQPEVVPIVRPKVPLGRPSLDDEPDPEAA